MKIQIYLNKDTKRDMVNLFWHVLSWAEILKYCLLCWDRRQSVKEAIDVINGCEDLILENVDG